MKREPIARAALHAFPPTMRSGHGEEMLDTLLDVSAASRTRFVRELIGVVRSGMQARATQTARAGAKRVVADGVCGLLRIGAADVRRQRMRQGVAIREFAESARDELT